MRILLLLFLSVSFSVFAEDATCRFTSLKETKDSHVKVNCPGQEKDLYLLGNTYITKPEYRIETLTLTSKTDPQKKYNFKDIDFFIEEQNLKCEVINCFAQMDIKEYLMRDKGFLDLIKQQAPDADLTQGVEINAYLSNPEIGENTPVFNAVPTGEYTQASDIILDPKYEYLLNGNTDEEGNLLSELSLKYATPSEEYQAKYSGNEEEADLDEFGFSAEEIAQYEAEAATEEAENEPGEVVGETHENIDDFFIENENILQELLTTLEESDPSSTENEVARLALEELTQGLEANGIVTEDEQKLGEDLSDDPKQEEQTTEQAPENPLPRSYEFKAGDESFQITELSESSNPSTGTSEVTFTISDGKKIQKFSTPNGSIEELRTLGEGYSKLRFENDKIYLTFDETDIEMPLEASNLGPEMSLEEFESQGSVSNSALSKCLPMLTEYLQNKDLSEEEVKAFLKLQSNLTLHRLAWAHLNNGNTREKIEVKILKLIKEKYRCDDGTQNCEKAQIAKQFDNINIRSRTFLAKALPLVKDTLNQQAQGQNQLEKPFHLNLSDVKMLEIISSVEGIKDGQHDHRQFTSPNLANNITNFASMVNSGYLYSDKKLTDIQSEQRNKDLLNSVIPKLEKGAEQSLKSIIYKACISSEDATCNQAQAKVNEIYNEDIDTLTSTVMNSLFNAKDEDYLNDLAYGKLWLRVAN